MKKQRATENPLLSHHLPMITFNLCLSTKNIILYSGQKGKRIADI